MSLSARDWTPLLAPAQLGDRGPRGLQAQPLLQAPQAAFTQRRGLFLVPRKENKMFLCFCSKWGDGGGVGGVINSLDLF